MSLPPKHIQSFFEQFDAFGTIPSIQGKLNFSFPNARGFKHPMSDIDDFVINFDCIKEKKIASTCLSTTVDKKSGNNIRCAIYYIVSLSQSRCNLLQSTK
jgi:hypothetical protein